MPVFRLTQALVFPDPELAEDGLLAIGGDLGVPRLLLAYRSGIFPWYGEGDPLLWWSPPERALLRPGHLHLSARTRRSLRHRPFEIRFDSAFEAVIGHCSQVPRPGQDGRDDDGGVAGPSLVLDRPHLRHADEGLFDLAHPQQPAGHAQPRPLAAQWKALLLNLRKTISSARPSTPNRIR